MEPRSEDGSQLRADSAEQPNLATWACPARWSCCSVDIAVRFHSTRPHLTAPGHEAPEKGRLPNTPARHHPLLQRYAG